MQQRQTKIRECLLDGEGRKKTYLLGDWVEPMSDVRACGEDNRVTFRSSVILADQKSQVVDFVEERHPDVTRDIVIADFFRGVESAELVGSRQVHGLVVARRS